MFCKAIKILIYYHIVFFLNSESWKMGKDKIEEVRIECPYLLSQIIRVLTFQKQSYNSTQFKSFSWPVIFANLLSSSVFIRKEENMVMENWFISLTLMTFESLLEQF